MNENCLKEFTAHWSCLEKNNQARLRPRILASLPLIHFACIGVLCVSQSGTKPQHMRLSEAGASCLVVFIYHFLTVVFYPKGWSKSIPGAPEGKTLIHLVEKPIYKTIQK